MEAINRAYDMRGLVGNLEYGQEKCLPAHPTYGAVAGGPGVREIAREQGS